MLPGSHGRIKDHLHTGIQALLGVPLSASALAVRASAPFLPRRRHVYYVRGEAVVWDYVPFGRNSCDRKPFAKDELISVDDRFEIDVADNVTAFAICSRCVKTRFVDYTDRTLSKRITRDGADAHLGLMGPVLHGRVGQAIIIHFRNNASEPVSMHPHDGSSHREKRDDSIAPGGSYIYRCHVPLRAGPGPGRR